MNEISDIYAVILCGGLGKRLGKLTKNLPKPLLKINKQPFLDYLIDYIKSFGIKNLILAAGYKAEKIEKYIKSKNLNDIHIYISKEKKLLGTAGAIKLAEKYIKSDLFFVFNGDTFCNVDLNALLKFHISKNSDITVVVSINKEVCKNVDSGYVLVDKKNRIIKFKEKDKISNYINAGIYVLNKKILKLIPKNSECSLEYDILPKVKNLFAYLTKQSFIDIGTPERYKKAIIYFKTCYEK